MVTEAKRPKTPQTAETAKAAKSPKATKTARTAKTVRTAKAATSAGGQAKRDFEAHYRNTYGVMAGYLPKDRKTLDAWHGELRKKVSVERRKPAEWRGSVKNLEKVIDGDPELRESVRMMIEDASALNPKGVKSISEMLEHLDHILTHPFACE